MTTTNGSFKRRAGFSMVEVMLVAALSAIILTAAVSSFLLISRSAIATSDYTEFDDEARKGLEIFAREVRMAENTADFSATGITLTVRDGNSTYAVRYAFDANRKVFLRAPGTADEMVLIGDIDRFELKRYDLTRKAATNDAGTKQLQLQLRSIRSGGARAMASNNVVSARFILRNKRVS